MKANSMRHFTFPLFFSLFLYVCVIVCVRFSSLQGNYP